MFPGMMDPELMRLAQEQMSRMSPTDLANMQQQMMSNPDLIRMASESMKNMRPEDLKHAAEQMKHASPDDLAEMREKMATATPEELAAMRARADAQATYELNAAQMLKKQGNELHSRGNYNDALQKYMLAKKNLRGIPSSKGRSLLLACSLNLMSCYLKTNQYDECIREGTEVLSYDAKNLKALYRRGQAYKELGQLEDAVSDLNQAHEVSPEDETIADVLRDAEKRLTEEGGVPRRRGLVIEEINEDAQPLLSNDHDDSISKYSASAPKGPQKSSNGVPPSNTESMQAIRDDPESIRTFQNFISQADPETLAALSNGKTEGISPDMVKTASNMISKMPPEELQRMLQLASSFQGGNSSGNKGSKDSSFSSSSPGPIPANVTPDMLKTASEMMSKMPAEELQKMFEMASSLRGKDSNSAATTSAFGVQLNGSNNEGSRESYTVNGNHSRESNSSRGFLDASTVPQSNLANSPQTSFPSSSADIQEQMRNQMKNPAMRQMLSSMMQNISPDMMANMSEQFGIKLSREDAEKAQAAMSSLSPDAPEKMIYVLGLKEVHRFLIISAMDDQKLLEVTIPEDICQPLFIASNLSMLEKALERLIEIARETDGREKLAAGNILAIVLKLCQCLSDPSCRHLLLLSLRLLRNLCAGESINQNSFIEQNGLGIVSSIIVSANKVSLDPDIVRIGLQILGNVSLAGKEHQHAVWHHLFTLDFVAVAEIRNRGTCDPLCMILYTCLEGNIRLVSDICSEKGLPVLIEIIRTASVVGSGEDWFDLLISKLCIEGSCLSPIFSKLLQRDNTTSKSDHFTHEQAFLLSSLSKALNELISDISIFHDFALCVLGIFRKAAAVVNFTSRGISGLPTGSSDIDVLGYSLTILRDICACDGRGNIMEGESLLSTELLELLCDLLCDLEPPAIIRKAAGHNKLDEGTSSVPGKCCPYKGFRRDLVAVIGNSAYRRKHVQDWIRENKKLLVLLQQCVVDEDNPFLREWGIWSMRNLLEGNEENQQKVRELEVQGSVNMPELDGLGLKVEVDPKNHRAKLVNVS